MSEAHTMALLAEISHDIVITCSADLTVAEANPVALRLLGPQISGRPFHRIIAPASRKKAYAFIERLRALGPSEASEPWELLFHVPRSAPLLASVRGGALDDGGGWLLVAGCEPPQLTALYHEVLVINNELTTLVRQISKDQALLAQQLARLLHAEEPDHGY